MHFSGLEKKKTKEKAENQGCQIWLWAVAFETMDSLSWMQK